MAPWRHRARPAVNPGHRLLLAGTPCASTLAGYAVARLRFRGSQALGLLTLAWGHFIYALGFVSSGPQKVLPVGIATELIRGDVFFWGALMAGALLASVPVVAVYGLFTRHFVAGLTAGATKY